MICLCCVALFVAKRVIADILEKHGMSSEQQGISILIVEDSAQNLAILTEMLGTAGYLVQPAINARVAFSALKYGLPELILLDIMMPEMDGFELCTRLKADERTRAIPVIFLSAMADYADKVKGFQVGGVDYITKPFHPEEVLARIKIHLTIRALQQQLQAQNALLAEQNVRFRNLADATFEGILLHEQGQIMDVNLALELMFERQRGDLLGTPVAHLLKRDEPHDGQTSVPLPAQGVKATGLLFPVEIQEKMIPYQGRTVGVIAVRDLTWQHTLETERSQLAQGNLALKASLGHRYRLNDLIGKSAAMQQVYELVLKAASTIANVLICGETGVGKELVARTIHELSARRTQPLVVVNCGAIPESLFERELFGHRKGAFTGADHDLPGYVGAARHGTLFLDEVGELSPTMQVKLLRVIETGEYMPVGASTSLTADVRVIAATNRNVEELCRQGKLREDFYYRIRVIPITVPPLRDRREDLPLLIEHILTQRAPGEFPPILPARLQEQIFLYDWPGNVRQLQNTLERYLTTGEIEFLSASGVTPDLFARRMVADPATSRVTLAELLEHVEKQAILNALQRHARKKQETAEMLGIDRRTLYQKMKKYGIS